MSWVNMDKGIEGYELECMTKVDSLVKSVIRPLTETEWQKMLNDHIPGYYMNKAVEYAMHEQEKRNDFTLGNNKTVTSTSTSISDTSKEER